MIKEIKNNNPIKEKLNSINDYKSDEETSQNILNQIEIIINNNDSNKIEKKKGNNNKCIIKKEFRNIGTQTEKIFYILNSLSGKRYEKLPEKRFEKIPEKKIEIIQEKKTEKKPEKKIEKKPEKKIEKKPEKKIEKKPEKKIEKKYLQKKRKNLFKTLSEKKIEKKSLIGRKRKNDKREGKHNKFSNDNCIYKIKNKCFNCVFLTLNTLIKKQDPNDQIKKIDGNIFKNGTKLFNLEFLDTKMSAIFLYQISSKYTLKYDNNNQNIIEKYSTNKLIQEILDMTFEECINNIFTMSSEEFKKKYNFENKYLLEKLKKDDEYSNLKELIDTGLSRYFLDIKERKIRNKVNYHGI